MEGEAHLERLWQAETAHLVRPTTSQLALIAARLELRVHGQENLRHVTRVDLARVTGCSETAIGRGALVLRSGIGTVISAVNQGKVSLTVAERIARLDPDRQKKIARLDLDQWGRQVPDVRPHRKTQPRPVPSRVRLEMAEHMTGRKTGIRDVQLINQVWQQNPDVIKELDEEDLFAFIRDLERSRQATSQLLRLIGEALIPGGLKSQSNLLSTALNKIRKNKEESGEK